MNHLLRPRNWEPACGTERSAASANNMAILPGVLGCRTLRRTVQVRKPIPRYRGTVARWQAHLRGLATAIHEISGLRFTLRRRKDGNASR